MLKIFFLLSSLLHSYLTLHYSHTKSLPLEVSKSQIILSSCLPSQSGWHPRPSHQPSSSHQSADQALSSIPSRGPLSWLGGKDPHLCCYFCCILLTSDFVLPSHDYAHL